jgi:nucleoside 2-deoxyribosyltransferase
MIIYIAGPISNDPDYKEKFAAAECALTKMGHTVINPAFLPKDLGDCTDYMKICFPMIDASEAVVLLEGWEQSFGACREWGYAMALDKLVLPIDAFDFEIETKDGEYRQCGECKNLVWCEGPKIVYHKSTETPCADFEEKDYGQRNVDVPPTNE